MNDRKKIMGDLEGLTFDDWRMFYSDSEVQITAKNALQLLKEQEPKEVKMDMYGNAYCPWCSTERTIETGLRKLHLGTNFCPWCGSAVKWNE